MIPDEIKIFLIMVSNMAQGARVEYFQVEAKRLLDKYTRPQQVGPSEFKDNNTDQTPVLHFRV